MSFEPISEETVYHGKVFDLVKNNPEFGVALLSAVGERARYIATCFAL